MGQIPHSKDATGRKYSHPVGVTILDSFEETPLSALDIAKLVDFPREKIYYHLKKLLANDLIYVAETEVVNGITKKRYLRTADRSDLEEEGLRETGETEEEEWEAVAPVPEGSGVGGQGDDEENRDDVTKKTVSVGEPEAEGKEEGNDQGVEGLRGGVEDVAEPVPTASRASETQGERTEEGILEKLLSGGGRAMNKGDTRRYDETASTSELTQSIVVDDVTYLIPEADYSLGGIDYVVRSAQREDGKEITLREKQLLADHLEYLRIGEKETGDETLRELSPEAIQNEEKRASAKKPTAKGLGLYINRRLNGYFNAVSFAQFDNKVCYVRASITRNGFKIDDQTVYSLPLRDGSDVVTDLTALIQYVYRNKIQKKNWRKLYLAYYTNLYPFDMDPLKTPDLKGNELEDFLKTNICKRFSVEPENAIVNWIEHKSRADDPQKYFMVSVADRSPIERDFDLLSEGKITPRFTTSVPKVQFDLYRYNYPEDEGNAILVFIGIHRTFITIVNKWEIKDSRSTVVSADDLIASVDKGSGTEGSPAEADNAEVTDIAKRLSDLDVRTHKKAGAVFEKLESEIYATLKYFKNEGHYLGKDILISGIGTDLPNIERYLSEDFDKNVSKLTMPKTVQYTGESAPIDEEDFSINIGLLLDPKDRLNMLPKRQRDNAKFIYPFNLGRIVGTILILFGSFISVGSYLKAIQLESELKSQQMELAMLKEQNNLLYDISYRLAVTDLIHGTKAYDRYMSGKVLQVIKFLTTSLPKSTLFDQLIFSKGEDGKTPTLTLIGRLSSPGAEANIVLNNMMYYLRDSELLSQVSMREQGTGESGTLNFTVDLNL